MKSKLGIALLLLAGLLVARAQAEEGSASNKPALALNGLCPVALVDMNKEVKGDANIGLIYKGYEYHLSDERAKKMFVADPDKYTIQLGGVCVSCVAIGALVKGDPGMFSVYNKKIYIFSNAMTKQLFEKNPAKYLVNNASAPARKMHRGS